MARRGLTKWAASVAIGLTLAACAPAPPSPGPEPLPPRPAESGLRVMTYNLLGAQADALVFSEHAGWAARVDQLQPDVLVLQEAQADDVQAFLDLPSTTYTLAVHVPWECDLKPIREGVAILVKATVGTLGAGGTHVGQTCFDPTVRRVLVWVDLDVDGEAFRVYGTHLTAGGGASAESRNAQIRLIRQLIAQQDSTDARRWVLAGDLNANPQDTSYRLLLGDLPSDPMPYRLVDTYAELVPDAAAPDVCPAVDADDGAAMAALLADPAHVRRCGYTSGWPKDADWLACDVLSYCVSWEQRRDLSVRVRIDDVLRADDGPVRVLRAFVPNREDADWAAPGAEWYRLSDHLPYVVDLEVTAVP